mgnify:CR=1 FL=1
MEINNNVEIAEVKKLTILERFKYFFTNPNMLFQEYNERPTWLLKTLAIVALSVIGIIISKNLIMGPTIDMMIQQSPDMPKEQMDMTIALVKSPVMVWIAALVGLITSIGAVFLGSVIYYGLISLFGGKTKYMKIVAVYSLAYIPYAIGTLVNLAFVYYTNNFDSMLQPGFSDAIFQRVDVFVIWQVLLLVFGFAKISNLKLRKTAIIVAIMWAIVTGISLATASMNRLF